MVRQKLGVAHLPISSIFKGVNSPPLLPMFRIFGIEPRDGRGQVDVAGVGLFI